MSDSESRDTFGTSLLGADMSMQSMGGGGYANMDAGDPAAPAPTGGGANLSLFMGVFVPVMLSIVGVIFFNRLGWILGQAGLLYTLCMFVLGYTVVTLTVFSLSAIATNGRIKGGGAYFLISRALGPELGGAIGLIFFFANVAGGAVYLLGFSETFVDLMGWDVNDRWIMTWVAISALFVLTIVCYAGSAFVAKTGFFIFITLALVIAFAAVSFFFQEEGCTDGYTGLDFETFEKNLTARFVDGYDFFGIFAILFPAVTGIMAGANMSGDLANPADDLPRGTLMALLYSGILYTVFSFILAFTVDGDILVMPSNYTIIQDVSFYHVIIAVGVFCATLSSAMGAIIGAAKILQALARDELFPVLNYFQKGDGADDEARRATILSFFLILTLLLLVSDLNTIATYQSLFFLLSYALVNFACFSLSVQGSPNWRPIFQQYSWKLSLAGMILCLAIMFLSETTSSVISIAVLLVICVYVAWSPVEKDWGDVTQSLLFHQVRKFLLRLDAKKQHIKFWRPQVMVLSANNPFVSLRRLFFANNLKKGGLLLFGSVVKGTFEKKLHKRNALQRAWEDIIDATPLKAFVEVTTADTIRKGVQSLLQSGGVGAFQVNTAMIGYFEPNKPSATDHEYFMTDNARESYKLGSRSFEDLEADQAAASPMKDTKSLKELSDIFDEISSDGKEAAGFSSLHEYMGVLSDVRKLNQHLFLTRNFQELELHLIRSTQAKTSGSYLSGLKVDIWDLTWIGMEASSKRDEGVNWSFQMCLLMAWILQRTRSSDSGWKMFTSLRVTSIVERSSQKVLARERIERLLKEVRIMTPTIRILSLDDHHLNLDTAKVPAASMKQYNNAIDGKKQLTANDDVNVGGNNYEATDRHKKVSLVNDLMRMKSKDTAVHFLPLLRPISRLAPDSDELVEDDELTEYEKSNYIEMGLLSEDLGPTVMVQAAHSVFTSEI